MTITDQPRASQNASIDKERLRQKYLEERNKRLRADGNDQYLRVAGQLAHYLDDPYTPVIPREAKTDHVTFAFIGGGFAGLATAARMSEAGIRDVRIIEISAAPGTGTGIRARNAIRRRWSTCRCSKKPATCRRRNMRMRRKSSHTASASASNTASTNTRCSTPRS